MTRTTRMTRKLRLQTTAMTRTTRTTPELALLRREMDALEHRMYSEGTVASVFACTVTQARLAGKPFGADAIAAMAAIFDWSENPDPGAGLTR